MFMSLKRKKILKGIPQESQHYVCNIVLDFISKSLYNSSTANNNYPTQQKTKVGLVIENMNNDTS